MLLVCEVQLLLCWLVRRILFNNQFFQFCCYVGLNMVVEVDQVYCMCDYWVGEWYSVENGMFFGGY